MGEEEGYGKNRDGKFNKMKVSESSKRKCQAGRWLSEHGAQGGRFELAGGGGVWGCVWRGAGLSSSLLVVKQVSQANLA